MTKLLTQAPTCIQQCLLRGDVSSDFCRRECEEGFNEITNPILDETIRTKTGLGFFQSFLPALVGFTLVIGVIVFMLVFLFAAITWMTSGGDKGKIETARSRLSTALIGLVILFSTFAIIALIEGFFSINILTLDIGILKIE